MADTGKPETQTYEALALAGEMSAPAGVRRSQEDLYREVTTHFAAPLQRLVRGYERDPDRARDLYQDILLALWRSCSGFEGRSSLRTWVYKVAHNVGASHIVRTAREPAARFLSLEDLTDDLPAPVDARVEVTQREALQRLFAQIDRLRPLDRQVILLYLEGVEPDEIAKITGLSSANVSTKVLRTKKLLTDRLQKQGAR